MINFLRYSRLYLFFSALLICLSVISILVFGLNLGIEFKGGSVLEVEYESLKPAENQIRQRLAELNLGEFLIQTSGEKSVILKMPALKEEKHQLVLEKLKQEGSLKEQRFESIGPVIGRELREKTNVMIVLATISIILYIAFAFRQVSFPVKSWQYGVVSLFILFNDIIIPLGVLSLLGKIYGVQFTIPVVVALLTILGYSINNNIIVFDRIRENLLKRVGLDYKDTVNISINQTLVRSFNTSFTTLLVLIPLYFFGGETLHYFTLSLILGILSGIYSSLFVAGPLLVAWHNKRI